MTEEEEEKRKQRRKEKARLRAAEWYSKHKDDPEFLKHRKEYRKKYYKEHTEVKEAQKKRYYKRKEEQPSYWQEYYRRNKERILENSKKWRAEHADYWREYQRVYSIKKRRKQKKEKKVLPSVDKIATIFKNPVAAEHYKWLMQKRGYKQESEVEHEEVNE